MSLTIGLGLIGSGVGPLAFGAVAEKGGLGLLPAVLVSLRRRVACKDADEDCRLVRVL